MIEVVKTACFRVHEPTRHKVAMIKYAMSQYHNTLATVLRRCLEDEGFEERVSTTLKSGRGTAFPVRIEKEARRYLPKNWACDPLKDYVLSDVSAMLSSYFELKRDPAFNASPPELRSLLPPTEEAINQATEEFTTTIEFQLPEDTIKKADEFEQGGKTRKAKAERARGHSRMASRAAGRLLRSTETALPRPIEYTRHEKRGFIILEREGRFFIALRLFGKCSKYYRPVRFSGMTDWKSKTEYKQSAAMVVFPISMSRDFHEAEYLKNGVPQSAKLVWRRDHKGQDVFTVNVAFKFFVEPVEPETIIGVDRGWKKIASCALLSADGSVLQSGIELEGTQFYEALKKHEHRIAELQKAGKRGGRRFRVRGRLADNAVGEFANRLVNLAAEKRSQVVLEELNAAAMNRFLSRSQLAKIEKALEYKLQREGLPKPVFVNAAYTSQTCAVCGHTAKANRPKADEKGKPLQSVFKCVRCQYEANADENAAVVIALRGIHQINWRKEKKRGFPKFAEFSEWLQTGRAGATQMAAGSCSGQNLDERRMPATCGGGSDPCPGQRPNDENRAAGAVRSAEPKNVENKS